MGETRLYAQSAEQLISPTAKLRLHSAQVHGASDKPVPTMWFRTLILAGSLALCLGGSPAMAEVRQPAADQGYFQQIDHRGGRGGDDGDHGGRRQNILSVREVAEILRGRFGGQLNNARLEGGDRPFYVIRWEMPSGDFRDFTVDAVTGQVR